MHRHVMVVANDLEKSKKCYDAIFAASGVALGVRNKDRYFYTTGMLGNTKPINGKAGSAANGGTTCEDPAGMRDGGMHLAYLRDPDGNKLWALVRNG